MNNNHLTTGETMRDSLGNKLVDLKNYQWPASNLTKDDMKILSKTRKKTGKSIAFLIHDAVQLAYNSK